MKRNGSSRRAMRRRARCPTSDKFGSESILPVACITIQAALTPGEEVCGSREQVSYFVRFIAKGQIQKPHLSRGATDGITKTFRPLRVCHQPCMEALPVRVPIDSHARIDARSDSP